MQLLLAKTMQFLFKYLSVGHGNNGEQNKYSSLTSNFFFKFSVCEKNYFKTKILLNKNYILDNKKKGW